jgi:Fe2+ transport system protein FeoA
MNGNLWLTLPFLASLILGLSYLYTRRRTAIVRPIRRENGDANDLLAAGLLPLANCPLNSQACLKCVQVDHCIVLRLREMGLTPGVQVRVVQDTGGPMLVSVRGSRVALGRELTENMWVELATPSTERLSH